MATFRYWAAAKEAAGRSEDRVEAADLAEALDELASRYAPNPGFARVLGICSFLVDGQPVGKRDPADIRLEPTSSVEVLPPFAGG